MQLQQNVSLQPYNTFGIQAFANYFGVFTTMEALVQLLEAYYSLFKKNNWQKQLLVLGGGSNILLTKDFDGVVLKNESGGISLVSEDENFYYLKAAAGENWHKLVLFCVENGYAGMENLSLIPGNVGASPMQNIGAYGVEIKDIFYRLDAYNLEDKKLVTFGLHDCEFGYRESVFKHRYKGRFVILSVTFRLLKKPVFNISYGAISDELQKMNIQQLSIRAVSDAVINIRRSKLPDPVTTGNAGSFFKNPLVSNEHFFRLQKEYGEIKGFAAPGNQTKLAAGWLIEQCGWKGFRRGDAGCYDKQALVLVNYGNATGHEIYELSADIVGSVENKFGVTLEREVNIL